MKPQTCINQSVYNKTETALWSELEKDDLEMKGKSQGCASKKQRKTAGENPNENFFTS